MAIKNFKEILQKEAKRVDIKDRKIFERGKMPAYFGRGVTDTIEFILYDNGDNQLPQGENGKMVRYINISQIDNIRNYLMIARGSTSNSTPEYFVDVEKLINEAGYKNGLFRTQITLLNKRVGFESPNEKLWIKQISPSRTEIKLLPLRNSVADKTDLIKRFGVMFSGAEFRDDIIQFIPEFVNKIDPQIIDSYIQSQYGAEFFEELVEEFNIKGFDTFTTKIYNKFVEAMRYEFLNRVSKIRDVNYGKPKPSPAPLRINKQTIAGIAERILVECIEFYLPQRVIQSKTEYDEFYDASVDKVGTVLQRKESDKFVRPPQPVVKRKIIKKEIQEVTELEIKVIKEVPKEVPVPVFVKPKPKPKPIPPLPPPPPKPRPIPKPIVVPSPPPSPRPVIPTPRPSGGGGVRGGDDAFLDDIRTRNERRPVPGREEVVRVRRNIIER